MLRLLRWLVWAGLFLVFVRGAATIVLPGTAAEPTVAQAAAVAVEPDGLRAFPLLFASEYLTWRAGDPEERVGRLRPYLSANLDNQAGWKMDASGRNQTVSATWVYGVQALSSTRWLVTVAARVEVGAAAGAQAGAGLVAAAPGNGPATRTLFLAVPVAPSGGGWVVYDYPTLIPPPTAAGFNEPLAYGQTVTDEGDRVRRLLTGFFRAYTGAGGEDVSYYLLPGVPAPGHLDLFSLESVDDVTLVRSGADTWALAGVTLHDPSTGARLTTRYTLNVLEQSGRWYIKEILQRGV